MGRPLFLSFLLLALSACGFQPRAQLDLPADLGPVRVVAADPYSALAPGLAAALDRAGATPAAADAPAATLAILSERLSTGPLSVDERAQVREYVTRYVVEFELRGADGAERIGKQVVELQREYTYDTLASAGSPAEQALVERELRRDMQAAIIRRLDVALRTPR